jgi:hypothetical protein
MALSHQPFREAVPLIDENNYEENYVQFGCADPKTVFPDPISENGSASSVSESNFGKWIRKQCFRIQFRKMDPQALFPDPISENGSASIVSGSNFGKWIRKQCFRIQISENGVFNGG